MHQFIENDKNVNKDQRTPELKLYLSPYHLDKRDDV